jgi:hypothetical protein
VFSAGWVSRLSITSFAFSLSSIIAARNLPEAASACLPDV